MKAKNDTKRRGPVEWRTKKQRLAMYQCENTCISALGIFIYFPNNNQMWQGGERGPAVAQTSSFPRSAKGRNVGHVHQLTMRICRRSSDVVHVVCRAPLDCIISRCISAGLSLWGVIVVVWSWSGFILQFLIAMEFFKMSQFQIKNAIPTLDFG